MCADVCRLASKVGGIGTVGTVLTCNLTLQPARIESLLPLPLEVLLLPLLRPPSSPSPPFSTLTQSSNAGQFPMRFGQDRQLYLPG